MAADFFSHIRFMQAISKRGISRNDLPYKARMMPYLAYYASFFIALIVLIQGFTAFAPSFQPVDFVAAYISVFLFVAIWFSFQLWFKCPIILKLQDVDIDSDRREIEEQVWIEPLRKTKWQCGVGCPCITLEKLCTHSYIYLLGISHQPFLL